MLKVILQILIEALIDNQTTKFFLVKALLKQALFEKLYQTEPKSRKRITHPAQQI